MRTTVCHGRWVYLLCFACFSQIRGVFIQLYHGEQRKPKEESPKPSKDRICALNVPSISFVQVFHGLLLSATTDLTNVALNKPATQSSYHPGYGRPEKVVDGNTGTSINQCTHTADVDTRPDRWWRVDLEGLFQVYYVVITNRGDCCGNRLANFDIIMDQYLSDTSQGYQASSKLCLHHSAAIATGATVSLDCSQPVVGRYLTLVIPTTTQPLHFCELKVMAKSVTLVLRAGGYQKQVGRKASGDLIREKYGKSVTDCIKTCLEVPGCTAVNIQRVTGKWKTFCQLLAYGGAALLFESGWEFCHLNSTSETFV